MPDGARRKATRRLRAFAFGGGAFDTIMQLGVVQALLVSRGKAPDHVVGISAGAVNAAALAEIMQDGESLNDPSAEMAMKVRRLHSFLDAYSEFPSAFVDSVLPDTFEINAKRPLKPVELPIHFEQERKNRAEATRSKAGLIHLFNDLLSVRMPVSAVTRIIRRILAIKQASELRRPTSPGETTLWHAVWLWLTFGRYLAAVADISSGLAYAAFVGGNRTLRRWLGSPVASLITRKGSDRLQRFAVSILGEENATAAGVILKNRILGGATAASKASLTLLLFAAIWLVPFRLVSPPKQVVDFLDAKVPLEQVQNANWSVVDNRLPAVRAAAIQLPTPRLEQLTRNIVALARASWDVLEPVGLIGWNFFVRNRMVLGVPIAIIAFAIALEMFIGLRVALLFLLVAIQTLNWYCAHWYDRFLPLFVAGLVFLAMYCASAARRRILQYYEIGGSILSSDALKAYLVRHFDRDYYGKAKMEDIIRLALEQKHRANAGENPTPKTLAQYSDSKKSPINVGVVAAEMTKGELKVIDEATPVVDAILAATAVVPFFPAQDPERNGHWMIDGMNVSNEPIRPLLDDLRARYAKCKSRYDNVKTVDIYPVSDIPIDRGSLPGSGNYSTLVDVGLRALELKQFCDATMERRLTRLYAKVLPADHAFREIMIDGTPRTFVHAGIFPIELETPARINRRLLSGSSPDDLKRMLRETVADGCRSALEAMLSGLIFDKAKEHAKKWLKNELGLRTDTLNSITTHARFPDNVASARASARRSANGTFKLKIEGASKEAVNLSLDGTQMRELEKALAPHCKDIIRKRDKDHAALPGSDEEIGPGLSEICRHCSLARSGTSCHEGEPGSSSTDARESTDLDQRLRLQPGRSTWPQWPREDGVDDMAGRFREDPAEAAPADSRWLRKPNEPVVSFLFGGGVFRGVFHMGVMNGLNEAGIQPNLVAGSSVGAIVAAMIAAVFKDPPEKRKRRILDLTGTFLAIDQLVLTDRFADFVRSFTLRAAEAEFSLHDLDRVLRRFDADGASMFSRRLRRAAAGLERLFYFSPFELYDVVKATRLREKSTVIKELRDDLEELLQRGGLAQEILGSEPLSLLIERHVSKKLLPGDESNKPLFESFLAGPKSILFLATATNLSAGALEILGARREDERKHVSLEYGLLASSAFPAVFRPRQSWEIFRDSKRDEKYIDGGTIDNLPLDAVARFLDGVLKEKAARRPKSAPHLIFSASLEVDRDVLKPTVDARSAKDCIELFHRARTFKYNRKIDAYARVQERLRKIREALNPQSGWTPLDLHIIVVKPNWLCSTFGFHPMLGFRRAKQAASIAHGCASTLATLHLESMRNDEWLKAWGAALDDINPASVIESRGRKPDLRPQKGKNSGCCWFRKTSRCPYSREALEELQDGEDLTREEIDEFEKVYRACGRRETHQKR